jgi:hypothetical protein
MRGPPSAGSCPTIYLLGAPGASPSASTSIEGEINSQLGDRVQLQYATREARASVSRNVVDFLELARDSRDRGNNRLCSSAVCDDGIADGQRRLRQDEHEHRIRCVGDRDRRPPDARQAKRCTDGEELTREARARRSESDRGQYRSFTHEARALDDEGQHESKRETANDRLARELGDDVDSLGTPSSGKS